MFCPSISEAGSSRSATVTDSEVMGGCSRPPLLATASSTGAQDAAPPPAGASSLGLGGLLGREGLRRDGSAAERDELPDPWHVLGTVDDPADAFRMSNPLRSSLVLDEETSPMEPAAETAAAAGGGSGGVADTKDLREEDSGESGDGSAADAGGGDVGAASEPGTEEDAADTEGGTGTHVRAAGKKVRSRHIWEQASSGALTPSGALPPPGGLAPSGALTSGMRAVFKDAADVLAPQARRSTKDVPQLAAAPQVAELHPPPNGAEVVDEDDPVIAAAARRGAAVAAAMHGGVVATEDTGEELLRLRHVVGRLAAHLDHMIFLHTRETR